MNSENSKTSEPHVLILKLTDKLDLKISENSIALLNLSTLLSEKFPGRKFRESGLSRNFLDFPGI